MLVRFKDDRDRTVYINVFQIDRISQLDKNESIIHIASFDEFTGVVVKGEIEAVAERVNHEAERMLKKLGIGSVENLTIN